MSAKPTWKKGRGKLGFLAPLFGTWKATADSTLGPVQCTRTFTQVLGNKYVQLNALWLTQGRNPYEEIALIGVRADGKVCFWSFTSDGKQADGHLADVSDVHPEAFGFEAQMPAGLARMVYWPDDENGFHWAVESKTQKGWNRFTHHHYQPA